MFWTEFYKLVGFFFLHTTLSLGQVCSYVLLCDFFSIFIAVLYFNTLQRFENIRTYLYILLFIYKKKKNSYVVVQLIQWEQDHQLSSSGDPVPSVATDSCSWLPGV